MNLPYISKSISDENYFSDSLGVTLYRRKSSFLTHGHTKSFWRYIDITPPLLNRILYGACCTECKLRCFRNLDFLILDIALFDKLSKKMLYSLNYIYCIPGTVYTSNHILLPEQSFVIHYTLSILKSIN